MWEALRARFHGGALARSFSSLRVRAYRRWSIAQLLSGTGATASQVAIAWLVIELGGDGVALGIVTGCMMLPTLILGPFIGVLVDRYSRRAVLLLTAAAQMGIAVLLAAFAFGGALELWTLMVISLVHGVVFAIDNPARQLLVMDLVGRDRVTSAVSMNEVIINGSRVLGPAVAGIALVTAGSAWCFVFTAVTFAPSILVLATLNTTTVEAGPIAVAESVGAWRFAARTPEIRATLLLAVCAAACYNIAVVVPLIVADVFRADGGAYGLLAVAFGVGALPGALLSATGPTMPRSGEVRTLGAVMSVAVLAAAASPTLPVMFLTLAVVGAAVMWFIARANAFVMLTTPHAIRGRVMGIWAMALPGSTVVTGLATGALADATDPRLAYASVGLLTLAVVLASWRGLRSVPQPNL